MLSLDGNRKMAQFLQLEEGFAHVTDKYGYHQCEEGYIVPGMINPDKHEKDHQDFCWHVCDLQFHKSFDWLVKVAKKWQHDHGETILDLDLDKMYNILLNKIISYENSNN